MISVATIAAANAALALAEELIPEIQRLAHQGDISMEDQAKVHARYVSLKAKAEGQFAGPEWKLSTAPAIGAYEQTR